MNWVQFNKEIAQAWLNDVGPCVERGDPLDHIHRWIIRHLLGLYRLDWK